MSKTSSDTSKDENMAQILFCWLKFVCSLVVNTSFVQFKALADLALHKFTTHVLNLVIYFYNVDFHTSSKSLSGKFNMNSPYIHSETIIDI
jgi:hypothetical protein